MRKRESFCISFRDAELWSGEFDGFFDDTGFVKEKFSREAAFVSRPSAPSLVLINLCETAVPEELGRFFIDGLMGTKPELKKVAFSGVGRGAKGQMQRYIKEVSPQFAVGFFDDLQKAKEWLV